ncbi:MAG: CobW family GTP-binding protein [Rubricoccaceae bacterium]
MTPLPERPVPVTVVTGFLGAGKTTLVNALLAGAAGRRLGVIVNDFGAINLDATELGAAGGTVLALEGGCVCCSLSAGLVSAVLALVGSDARPEHLVVEASGVSDPLGIVLPLVAGGMQPLVRLAAVLAVVDVGQVGAWPSPDAEALAEAQVRAASVVVLAKTGLHGEAARWGAEDWVRGLAPAARVLAADDLGPDAAALLLDTDDDALAGLLDPAARRRPVARHADLFQTWTFETDMPFASLATLRRTLADLPTDVVRAKGLVRVADSTRAVRFHLAGRSLATRFLDAPAPGAPASDAASDGRSRLAVLGLTLDPPALDAAFRAALAHPESA